MPTWQPPGRPIIRVEVGSTLHGTQGDDSTDDRDELEIVVENPEYVTGLNRWETHVYRTAPDGQQSKKGDLDLTYYSLRKFMGLACQGNPSIIAALYAPEHKVMMQTNFGIELQALAPHIVSKQAVPRYRGYMRSQALRLLGEKGMGRGVRTGARPELVAKYGYDTKFAMHMVRLGCQGRELCETGQLVLPMRGHERQVCRAIRNGQFSVDDALEYAIALDKELATYVEGDPVSLLRDEPNYAEVNRYLHATYINVWDGLDDYDAVSTKQGVRVG